MASQNRMMTLVAFLQAQNCSNLPGSWRHPATMLDFLTPEYYQRIARTLEDGKIQMTFFDDRLALPDIYTGHHAAAVAAGVRAVKMDPSTILMTMGMVTQRLGLGVTYSTTYYEPFHVARLFATMDLMLKGRAAWNIVTSLNSAEARNFGSGGHMQHDARYDRADEFMEVVLGHWNTWEDDALILDKGENRFADPAKVHRLDHQGRYFRSRGPFSVPRSPQGHPVLIQAGQSGRGTVKEHTMFCGNPRQVADQMEEWFAAPACDGFVLAASSMPGAYDDVVRLLVPELQRRGLFQKEYAGPTLRDNFGLPIPRAADWHAARGRPLRRRI